MNRHDRRAERAQERHAPKGPDLATREGAETYAKDMMTVARMYFDEYGHHPFMAHVFATAPPEGAAWPEGAGPVSVIRLSPDRIGDPASKDKFAAFVRFTARETKAIGVLIVMEMWMLSGSPELRDRVKSIEGHPDAKEGIFVHLEHIRTDAIWRAMITRSPSGAGTLGPFERASERRHSVGRFMNVLEKERFQ